MDDVEKALASLPKLGFSVMRSKSKMGSVVVLAKVVRDVSWRAKNGSIDTEFMYDEFIARVNRCDEREGNVPDNAEHMCPAAPVVGIDELVIPRPNDHVGPLEEEEDAAASHAEEDGDEKLRLSKLSSTVLKAMCKERCELFSGSKKDLISRLLRPRKPEVLITRHRRNLYVPKVPSCNAALMVAMLLNHEVGTAGLTKEKLMVFAEATGISRESMSGSGGWYDGWAGIKVRCFGATPACREGPFWLTENDEASSFLYPTACFQELLEGDPALVCVAKKRYSLTTRPEESSGVAVARALHIVAHQASLCVCGAHVVT